MAGDRVIWTALAVAVAGLAPGQAGQLTVDNVRYTRGVLGPVRSSAKVLPGDSLYLCFDIDGISVDDAGKVHYSMALEVTTAEGKVVFKQDPRNLEAAASLGGSRITAFANVNIGFEQPAGEYTLKVTVADVTGGGKANLSKTFEVQPKDFGLVQLTTTADAEGLLPVPAPGAGQGLWLHFGAVGFARDPGTKQPNVMVSMRVLDESGKPTQARPVTGGIDKNVAADAIILPVGLSLLLNRPGKFTVELTATDKVSNKQDTLTFPLTVVEGR
jgi:hypothetical protein